MRFSNGNIHKKPTKAKMSSQMHLPVLVFEIELILSQKQEPATKEQQKPTNGKWKRVPKTKTKTKTSAITSNKKQQRAFFFPIFIHLLQLWAHGKCLTSRAMKNQKEQQQTTKGSKKQQNATKTNKKQKRTSELEKPKRAIRSIKSPNVNQALLSNSFHEMWLLAHVL